MPMQAIYVAAGQSVPYTPTTDVAAGDVVVRGDLVGVATQPIKANTLGALAVEGVFAFAKNTGVAYSVGTVLYWDDAANVVTTTASGNKLLGKVVRDAASADTSVQVLLRP